MKPYEQNIFNEYDIIIIDTSAAMHYWALKKFISDSEKSLLSEGKKVFVPKVVWMELVRAYNSNDPEKIKRLGTIKGGELENMSVYHPLYDTKSLIILKTPIFL